MVTSRPRPPAASSSFLRRRGAKGSSQIRCPRAGSPGSVKKVHAVPSGRRLSGKKRSSNRTGRPRRTPGSTAHYRRREYGPRPELFQGDDVRLVGYRVGQVPVVLLVARDTPYGPRTSPEDRHFCPPEAALDDA